MAHKLLQHASTSFLKELGLDAESMEQIRMNCYMSLPPIMRLKRVTPSSCLATPIYDPAAYRQQCRESKALADVPQPPPVLEVKAWTRMTSMLPLRRRKRSLFSIARSHYQTSREYFALSTASGNMGKNGRRQV